MRTILVSVSDKTGLDNFLKRLERFDTIKAIATGGTYDYIAKAGLPCTKVEEVTNFPEILGGRVKTLHPKVLAGILSRPTQEDRSCLSSHDMPEIDMVVVNLYPFAKKLKEKAPFEVMIENIDIGGVTLLRAAAKNLERVAIVSSPEQYDMIIANMDANGGQITADLRKQLAWDSFKTTSNYDQMISSYFASQLSKDTASDENQLPQSISINLTQHESLRYGENPHQAAAWFKDDLSRFPGQNNFPPFEQLQGKEISANNIVDVYALCRILKELKKPAVCIIKHNNPCGVALGKNEYDAFERAYNVDPMSAFGGIYGIVGNVDKKLAEKIIESFVEVVAAPTFDKDALEIFQKKKNIRILKLDPILLSPAHWQSIHMKDLQELGWIVEKDVEAPVLAASFTLASGTKPKDEMLADIAFTWSIVKHLTSNAIFIAKNGLSLGFGVGQTSRIASMEIALKQAGKEAHGAILASDAFFPATDNIEAAAKAGISVIIQPGGSLKDKDVIAACEKHGITMLFTGQRCFRH